MLPCHSASSFSTDPDSYLLNSTHMICLSFSSPVSGCLWDRHPNSPTLGRPHPLLHAANPEANAPSRCSCDLDQPHRTFHCHTVETHLHVSVIFSERGTNSHRSALSANNPIQSRKHNFSKVNINRVSAHQFRCCLSLHPLHLFQ